MSWTSARQEASSLGGYLATLTTAAENDWVFAQVASAPDLWNGPQGPYLGGFRDLSSPCGPNCGWRWVTEEPWAFAVWDRGNPSGGSEAFLHFGNTTPCWCPAARWNDIDDVNPGWPIRAYIVEWSADCNGDGLVDLGQLLDGTLVDANGNYVPDVCESGGGGTGVELIVNGGFSMGSQGWKASNIDGAGGWRASGGQPAGMFILNDSGGVESDPTIRQTVGSLVEGARYLLTGDFRGANIINSPVGGISFAVDLDGSTVFSAAAISMVTWQSFAVKFEATSSTVEVSMRAEIDGTDNDFAIDNISLVLVEHPACVADVSGDGVVDGADLAIMLDSWGTAGGGEFDCDLNGDGVVGGADLTVVLDGWGPCSE
ncbi:MAG: hypothetical protein LW806_10855 [Planctomycetaceae bacterium]|nr:hypothetical protein [Planctomycetaceae bacterium]